MTNPQVTELLKLGKATLSNWRTQVGPSFYRSGRFYRYRGSDVLAWIEEQRVVPESG